MSSVISGNEGQGGSRVLDTAESIVIDGANAVTPAPRLGFPSGAQTLGLAVVVIALTMTLRRRAAAKWLIPALLVLACVPGLIHVLLLRADAPLKRPALAAKVVSTLAAMKQAAPWPRPVHVDREDDDVLFPFARYAVPSRVPSGPDVIELEVGGTQLPATCHQAAAPAPVRCGDSL